MSKLEEAKAFTVAIQKFVDWTNLEGPTHEFCCEYHKDVLRDIRRKALAMLAGGGRFTEAQLDYARAITKGEASHRKGVVSKTTIVMVSCRGSWTDEFRKKSGKFIRDDKGEKKVFKVHVPCENKVRGTCEEINSWNNKCEEHREVEVSV